MKSGGASQSDAVSTCGNGMSCGVLSATNTGSAVKPKLSNSFHIIAHMINYVKQIDGAIASGANGIEFDINFGCHFWVANVYETMGSNL
jgi:hypothetical protein